MTAAITNWIQNTFTANPYLITLLVSMIPTIEVRGGITIAIGLGMKPWLAWIMSCVSGLIVCPVLLLCLIPCLKCLKRVKTFAGIAERIETFFRQKASKIGNEALCTEQKNVFDGIYGMEEKRVQRRKFVGIFLFVAFPLPLTGLWTGSAVAAFLGLKFHYSVLAIVLGNFVCGLIITLLNMILGENAPILLIVLAIFVAISIVSLGIAVKRKNSEKKEGS